jgi:streptogramin lyase
MLRSCRRLALAGLACALALVPAAAVHAEDVRPPIPLAGPANGVTAGADGNVYVVESFNHSVAVLSPTGALIRRVNLNAPAGAATSAALGPDGRVWVAITTHDASRGFLRIDTSGNVLPQATTFACGPAGMASSGGRMLFTAPDPESACGASFGLGSVDVDGAAGPSRQTGYNAYDLAIAGGRVFVPDFDGNVVRRYANPGPSWPAEEATYGIPSAAGADGIEVGPGGQLFITMLNSGQVARLDPNAANGTNAVIVASGLVEPFGMARGADGALYVASKDARLLRIAPDGSQRGIALPATFKAWQVAAVGSDIWVTDEAAARVVRLRNAGIPDTPVPGLEIPAPAPAPPGPAPAPAPPGKPAAQPKVADVVSLASTKRCLSKRRLTLTVRKPKAGAAKVTSVTVTVGRRKARTYTARKLKVPVTLAGLPKGSFTVKLSVRLSDGSTLTETRTYRTCAKKQARHRR